jgi:hypothetical protein
MLISGHVARHYSVKAGREIAPCRRKVTGWMIEADVAAEIR